MGEGPGRTGHGLCGSRDGLWRLAGALALGGLVAVSAPRAWADQWTLQTGIHVDAWSDAQDGRQVLAPFSLAFDTPSWGASVRGAYGTSERDPGGEADRASITGLTDTTVSGYLRLTLWETDLRVGLDLDLPTGVSRLRTPQLLAVQDEDLGTVERFGEGFDINPTLSAYRNFGAFGAGLGIGYLKTGKFDPTRDTPDDDLDPGDELTLAVLGDVYATDTIRVILRGAYVHFTSDERRGVETLREGDEVDVLVSAQWRPEPWWLVITLRDVVRLKAERADAAGQLRTEPRNSSGNEVRAGVTGGYILDDAWSVRASVDVRHVAANEYPSGDPLHDGGRTKVALGPGVTWSPGRTFAIEAWIRYFILDAEQGPAFPRATTVHGVHGDLRVTYRF